MAPLSSVLCAIDFSNHSRLAFRAAATLAAGQHVRLRLVHVIDMLLAEAAAVAYDEAHLLRAAEEDLERFAAEECALAGIHVDRMLEVRIGRPDREIVQAAEEHGAGVIVLGTHGLGGFRKLFFGSVTERVLRKASTPVLAVPLDERHHATSAPYTIRGVLAAVDIDETALPLALAAQQVALTLGASLTLVHAVAPLQAIGAWANAFEQELPVRLDRARNSLSLIAQVLDRHHPPAVIVRSGTPADEIADVAASMEDLVIVVGLGGGWMLHRPGSTAYRVLCLSTVPVLALPPEAIARLTSSLPVTTTTTTTT